MKRQLTAQILLIHIVSLLSFGATARTPHMALQASTPVKSHQQQITEWQKDRHEYLKKEDGWLSLTGLFWLTSGMNGIGSESDNKVILPKDKAVDYLGSYLLNDGKITANFPPNSQVFEDGKAVLRQTIETDHQQKATILNHGSLSWYVIEREGRFGVRVRDSQLPQQKSLATLGYFDINPAWIIDATFTPYKEDKQLQVPTVMDWYWQASSPGQVTFSKDGQQHQLDIIDSGDVYFIIFGDKTNGGQTYGAGRFLYIDKPKAGQSLTELTIDFNMAHNPPCVFTPFATCPLPPPQNKLALDVTAGEKNFHL
ncbi:MAG: hypothetical protein ACI8WB_001064 [Phenylobacterium sp.]|jgi:uncharacterized protein (DUF1684 family)